MHISGACLAEVRLCFIMQLRKKRYWNLIEKYIHPNSKCEIVHRWSVQNFHAWRRTQTRHSNSVPLARLDLFMHTDDDFFEHLELSGGILQAGICRSIGCERLLCDNCSDIEQSRCFLKVHTKLLCSLWGPKCIIPSERYIYVTMVLADWESGFHQT